jgi:hypothetical protein
MTPQQFEATRRRYLKIFKGEDDADNGNDAEALPNSTVSHLADLACEAGIVPDRAAALRYLLRTRGGAAVLRRLGPHLRTLKRSEPVGDKKPAPLPSAADLRAAKADVVRKLADDATSVAKAITTSGRTYGLSRDEFTHVIEDYATRQHPQLSKYAAFAKVLDEHPELHQALRVIKDKFWTDVAKRDLARSKIAALPFEVTLQPKEVEGLDEGAALKALNELAAEQRARASWMSVERAFSEIFGNPDNAEAVARYKEARARALGVR